ncbi:MAG: hypothetical protein ACOCXM_10180 [Myxococcota bacterium]
MRLRNRHTSLVIAERESAWDRWVDPSDGGATAPVLLVQEGAESSADFAQRVRSHVASLESTGEMPPRAVLVGGRQHDGALSSRSLMIRAIAHGLATAGGGDLWLDSHGSDRYTMRALADTVSDMVRGSGVAVQHAPVQPEIRPAAHLQQVA